MSKGRENVMFAKARYSILAWSICCLCAWVKNASRTVGWTRKVGVCRWHIGKQADMAPLRSTPDSGRIPAFYCCHGQRSPKTNTDKKRNRATERSHEEGEVALFCQSDSTGRTHSRGTHRRNMTPGQPSTLEYVAEHALPRRRKLKPSNGAEFFRRLSIYYSHRP